MAITLTGTVSFVSKCWDGWVSDTHLTVNSGLLQLIYHVDLVIADDGCDIADPWLHDMYTQYALMITKYKHNIYH